MQAARTGMYGVSAADVAAPKPIIAMLFTISCMSASMKLLIISSKASSGSP